MKTATLKAPRKAVHHARTQHGKFSVYYFDSEADALAFEESDHDPREVLEVLPMQRTPTGLYQVTLRRSELA